MINDNKITYDKLFIFLFSFYVILRPSPTYIFGGVIGMRLVDLILVVLLILFIVFNLHRKIIFDQVTVLLILILTSQFFTIMISNFKGLLSISDFIEIYRPITYILTYIVFRTFFKMHYLNNLKKVIILSLILGYIELFNLFSLTQFLQYIYDYSKSRDLSSTSWRIVGSFYNPNYFGYFLALVSNIAFILILHKIKLKFSLIVFFFSFTLIFYTGSRTALISFLITISITVIIFLISRKINGSINKKWILILLTLITTIVAPYFFDVLLDNFKRFSDVENIKYNFYTRVHVWENSLYWIEKNVLFGNGPAKNIINSFDNNYVLILFRYGLINLILFLSLIIYIYIKAIKIVIFSNERVKVVASIAMIAQLNIINITMLTAIPFDYIQTGVLFIAFIAIYFTIINEKSISNEN